MSATNRIMKNTGILYIRMGITVFISLYSTRVILNTLGSDDFGIFNLVAGSIAMLTFLNTAMASATQRFMSFSQGAQDKNLQREIFNVSTVLHLIIAAAVFIILEIAGYFLFDYILKIPFDRIETAKLVLQFMIVSTVFTIISVPYDAVINAHENMFLFAVVSIIEAILKLAIALYLSVSTFDKLTTFGFLTAVLSIFVLILRKVYCNKMYEECTINLKKYFNKLLFREMFSFAGWSFLGASSSMFANYGQGIVLNMFFGPIVNAAQGISNQVSGQLGGFAGTMLKALNPTIVKSEGAGNRSLMLKASLVGSKTSFFLLLLFYIPVFIEMPTIFELWLKDIPPYTIIFCRLLLIRNLLEQFYVTLANSISAVGNIRNFQVIKSVLAVLPLFISYVLFKYNYSPFIIYEVFILYALLDGILTVYFAKIYCNLLISTYIKSVIFPCLIVGFVSVSLSCLPMVFMQKGILRLSTILFISIVSLITSIWTWGLDDKEKGIGINLINKITIRIINT